MKKLEILYAGNDKAFDGLYLSILTMLNRTKSVVNINVLTGNFKDQNKNFIEFSKKHTVVLKKLVKGFNKLNSINFVDVSKHYLKFFGTKLSDYQFTPYSMLRLFADKVYGSGVVLYLDTDTLFCGDVKSAFDINMDNTEMCVCTDKGVGWYTNHGTYFNAGVILFNIGEIKKTKLLQKAIKYCVNEKNPRWLDQDALNDSWTNIINWDHQYNFNYQRFRYKKGIVIYHFSLYKNKPKPWKIEAFNKFKKKYHLNMWDNDYKTYFKMKKSINEKLQ